MYFLTILTSFDAAGLAAIWAGFPGRELSLFVQGRVFTAPAQESHPHTAAHFA